MTDDPTTLVSCITALFPGPVGVGLVLPGAAVEPLWPGEEVHPAGAARRRRREFAAGRQAARRALAAIGGPLTALPAGPGGVPQWPAGFAGSISHCPGLCAAVAARRTDLAGIGFDAEDAAPLEDALVPMVCTPAELTRLAGLPALSGVDWPKLTFGAKEAWYKFQWPQTRRFCGFDAAEVQFLSAGPTGGQFRLTAPWAGPAAALADGAWTIVDGLLLCGVAARR